MAIYKEDKTSCEQVIDAQQRLVTLGLTSGTSGNVSVRIDAGLMITPTGMVPEDMRPEHVVPLATDGSVLAGDTLPSSEWRIHVDIYRAKPEVNAVVHCHSPYATILACAHRTIPAQHYMIAAVGCDEIPLAQYATFGTGELSGNALGALENAKACLLANHGQVATGATLEEALKLAALVEELAHWHWGALAIGGPVVLNDEQMAEVRDAFSSYGQQDKAAT